MNKEQREKGQGLVEYALILVLVSVAVIGILVQLGPQISNVFQTVVDNLDVGAGETQPDPPNVPSIQYQNRDYTAPGTWSWTSAVTCGPPPAGRSECVDPGPGVQACYITLASSC